MNIAFRTIGIALLVLALNGTALECVLHCVLAGSKHHAPIAQAESAHSHAHHGHHGSDHHGSTAESSAHSEESDADGEEVCHHNGFGSEDLAILDQELRTLQATLIENPQLDQLNLPLFIKLPAIREVFQPPIEHPPQAIS